MTESQVGTHPVPRAEPEESGEPRAVVRIAPKQRNRGVTLTHTGAIRRERGHNYSRAKAEWTRNGHRMTPAEYRALNDTLNDLRDDIVAAQQSDDLAAIRAKLDELQGGNPAPIVTELSQTIDALDAELTESSYGEETARDFESHDGTEHGSESDTKNDVERAQGE